MDHARLQSLQGAETQPHRLQQKITFIGSCALRALGAPGLGCLWIQGWERWPKAATRPLVSRLLGGPGWLPAPAAAKRAPVLSSVYPAERGHLSQQWLQNPREDTGWGPTPGRGCPSAGPAAPHKGASVVNGQAGGLSAASSCVTLDQPLHPLDLRVLCSPFVEFGSWGVSRWPGPQQTSDSALPKSKVPASGSRPQAWYPGLTAVGPVSPCLLCILSGHHEVRATGPMLSLPPSASSVNAGDSGAKRGGSVLSRSCAG